MTDRVGSYLVGVMLVLLALALVLIALTVEGQNDDDRRFEQQRELTCQVANRLDFRTEDCP